MRDITPARIRANNEEAQRILSGSIDHGDTFPFTVQQQGDQRGVFDARTSTFIPAEHNTAESAAELAKALHAKHFPRPGRAAQYNPKGN